ncbi:recombinase family protein [Paenibacillus thailandensis]|uniref:recombinase family protein n=1 Tax=Paenibacillus thailandensis TaxID=393250 RepID=UPI0036450A1E
MYTFYGRVSTDSNSQIAALDNQEEYWREYFIRNNLEMNLNCGAYYSREGELVPKSGYYIDEGISGYRSKKYRKAFMRMIEDAKQKRFDMIYTRSISRFGRNVEDIIQTINDLRKYNVGVFFEDINANTLDRNDDFKILIFTGLAQEESRLKSSSVQKGKATSAKNGVWSGREPYGYDIYTGNLEVQGVLTYVKGVLVINQEEAIWVRKIFDLYLNEGWGTSKIAKYLNTEAVPRKRNSKKWDQSIISKILSNVIYKGEVWQHRTYKKDPQQNIIESVPEEQQIRYQDERLRIIDDATFDKVQKIKQERFEMFGDFKYEVNKDGKKVRIGIEKTGQRYSSRHIFSNLLRCGYCEGTLRFKRQKSTSGKTHLYYFCVNNEKLGVCNYRNLQKHEELLEHIKNEVLKFRTDRDMLSRNFDRLLDNKYSDLNVEYRLKQLEEQLSELQRRSDLNFDLYADGVIDKDEYGHRNNQIKAQREESEREVNRLKYIDTEIQSLKDEFADFIKQLDEIDVENLSNQVLRQIIDKITVKENNRYIEWKFMGTTTNRILFDSIDKVLGMHGIKPTDIEETLGNTLSYHDLLGDSDSLSN